MNLFLQEIPASERTIKTNQETPAPVQDPLIARGLQKEQYAGIIGLAIALIAAVGFLVKELNMLLHLLCSSVLF